MPMPKELHMPPLANLRPNMGSLLLNVVFLGTPSDEILRRHFVNVVRLADLCVSEYEIARSHIEASLPNGSLAGEKRLWALLSGVDHLELCVIIVRRALNALEAVVRHPSAPMIDRIARRALSAFEGDLRPTRDAIAHIEEDIAGLERGQPHALIVSEDGRVASIGEHQISLTDLSRAIERLHEQTKLLSEYRETEYEEVPMGHFKGLTNMTLDENPKYLGEWPVKIGIYMFNFTQIEAISYKYLNLLEPTKERFLGNVEKYLGNRIDRIVHLVEVTSLVRCEYKEEINNLWKEVKRLAKWRNRIAHNPVLPSWKPGSNPDRDPPDVLGVPDMRDLKESSILDTVSIEAMGMLIEKSAALGRKLLENIEYIKKGAD